MEGSSSSDSRLSKQRAMSEGSVEGFEDRFKLLPMSILLVILSFLPVEHSAKTSVLAKYWKGLWLLSPRLDFDASGLARKLKASRLPESEWGSKYAEWVNKVLSAHKALHSGKAHVFEEIRFCFKLDELYEQEIDAWLSYALSLKVESLELNLLSEGKWKVCSPDVVQSDYRLPTLLDPCTNEYSTKPSRRRKPLQLSESRLLKSVTFAGVNVSSRAIAFLLRKFPLLQSLEVRHSGALASIKICGVALKHVLISDCESLESIIVRDACKLVSLKIFGGGSPELVLENVPMLSELRVSAESIQHILPWLFVCLSRVQNLKVLTLALGSDYIEKSEAKVVVPQLPQLNQLVLIIDRIDIRGSPIPLVCLLLRLMLKVEKFTLNLRYVEDRPDKIRVEYEDPVDLPLEHLRVVELRGGYHHLSLEHTFLKFVLREAKALASVVLKPSDKGVLIYRNTPGRCWATRGPVTVKPIQDAARARAEKIREEMPSSVKLEVL